MPVNRNNPHGRPRQWPRTLFTDCPKDDEGLDRHYGSKSTGKVKVMCTACLEYHIALETSKQDDEVATGARVFVMSREEIIKQLWHNPPANVVVSTQGATMKNHIKNCSHNKAEDRERAKQGSPTKPRNNSHHSHSDSDAMSVNPQALTQLLATVAAGSMSQTPSISLNSPALGLLDLPDASGSSMVLQSFLDSQPYASSSAPTWPHPPASAPPSSLGPSDSASAVGAAPQSTLGSRPLSRVGSQRLLQPAMQGPPLITWSEANRIDFKKRILRLTASANFPLSWVDNPEFHLFCDAFLPGCPRLTRKSLMTVLRDTVNEFRAKAKAKVSGNEVTLQSDGWTGINNRHLNAFMITCLQRVLTVQVNDTTKDRKTADKLLEQIDAVFKMLEDSGPNGWNAEVIGLVTDASGDARKARKDFLAMYPHVIVLDCYAHQINLVVGDLLKSGALALRFSEDAVNLIGWLRSKTRLLSYLPFAVLRAVLTRWTAHYMAFRRLLDLYPRLTELANADPYEEPDKRLFLTGDTAAQTKAQQMINIIINPSFWKAIATLCTYLEPLAIAANITQGVTCRLDQVLITFAYLFQKYSHASMSKDITARDAVLASLEKRWAKADQEVFVAAVLVNPFYQSAPFRPAQYLNEANMSAMLKRLYTRFFRKEPPIEFGKHLLDFFYKRGFFENLDMMIKDALISARKEDTLADPIAVLKSFNILGHPESNSPFIVFACRILSISANSASCERLFSTFGNTLTKQRNRLSTATLVQLSEVKMHIRDEHLSHGTKKRLRRQFEARMPPPDPLATQHDRSTTRQAARNNLATTIQRINDLPSFVLPAQPSDANTSDAEPLEARRPSEFAEIVAQHLRMVDADEDPQDMSTAGRPRVPLTSAPVNSRWKPVKLSDLFNFSHPLWLENYSRFANNLFDDEIEFYDLADSGTDGAVESDFDDATQDIIANFN